MAGPRPTVLIVGGGGREHALGWALARSAQRPTLIFSPGNGGTRALGENVAASGVDAWTALALERAVDLVVVGPEAPLVAGLANRLRAAGVAVLGPDALGARLEAEKSFAKTILEEAGAPTASYVTSDDPAALLAFARDHQGRVAVKADGLAGGKGVIVCGDLPEATRAIDTLRAAGHRQLLVEARLEGEELSVIALTDGERVRLLAPSQDHKRARDGDQGPNTGGMGAYAPAPKGTGLLLSAVEDQVIRPVLEIMAGRGAVFRGFLYAGLMLTADGPKVLEFNVRLGDPEAQVILPLLAEDAYELLLASARGALPAGGAADPIERAATTVVLAAEGYPAAPRTGDVIEGLDVASADEGVLVFHAGTKRDGERVVTSGGRVLAVTGMAETLTEATERAYASARKITWPGQHFRRDIAARALGKAIG